MITEKPDTSIRRRDFLKQFALLTGSVAFGVATENSDVDYLIPADKADEFEEMIDSEPVEYWSEEVQQFSTYRDGNENYIVAKTLAFEQGWRTAHAACVEAKPSEKAERIRIFRHHLYGEPLVESTTENPFEPEGENK